MAGEASPLRLKVPESRYTSFREVSHGTLRTPTLRLGEKGVSETQGRPPAELIVKQDKPNKSQYITFKELSHGAIETPALPTEDDEPLDIVPMAKGPGHGKAESEKLGDKPSAVSISLEDIRTKEEKRQNSAVWRPYFGLNIGESQPMRLSLLGLWGLRFSEDQKMGATSSL